jgi:ferrous iron transport protein B
MNTTANCHGGAGVPIQFRNLAATKKHVVAVVGPPNSGKSTLFNALTGLRQKVANFPGVTVEHHVGTVKLADGQEVFLVDLPGVYSLTPRSEDERVTHDALKGMNPSIGKPDAVLLILDSTNLNRHMVLAAPVLSLKIPTLVILNMADDLTRRGGELDIAALAHQLSAPVALISAARGEGLEKIFQFLSGISARPLVQLPILQLPILQDVPKCRMWAGRVGQSAGYIAPAPPMWTRRLDAVFLHPVAGPAIFAMVVVAIFQTIFAGAKPLMDGVQELIAYSGAAIGSVLPEGLFRSLLIDGIWSGVGSVLVFLPQILILFLFIGVLEDSGYLARAALIADRTMSRVGLQGKSFIPLLSAYACAVPAIMATRTIENKRDRIATILIAPFMTCSARLPVYTLIIAAFIPDKNFLGPFLGQRAAAMLGLYLIGFLAAIFTAKILKSSILKSGQTSFIMEMPPYRLPTLRSLGIRLYDRAMVFLRRAGTVILGVAVILWVLASLPLDNGKPPAIENSIAGMIGHAIEPAIRPLGFNWKIGIGLITSLAAREVIVGTLGTIYGIEGAKSTHMGLQEALRQDLTPRGAFALLIFFAFAMQCFSTIAVVRRETGGWKWPAIQFAYMTCFAYVSALIINNI